MPRKAGTRPRRVSPDLLRPLRASTDPAHYALAERLAEHYRGRKGEIAALTQAVALALAVKGESVPSLAYVPGHITLQWEEADGTSVMVVCTGRSMLDVSGRIPFADLLAYIREDA